MTEPKGLVVTRRQGESVTIGDPQAPLGVVKIVSVRGNQVRVLFDFPRGLAVDRTEIAIQKDRQRREGA